jgi:Ca2+/H+ antiporter, TMEM165/GDT1 family
MKDKCCKYRFLIPVFILAFLALFSFAVFGLWNHVLVDVLGVKAISYWQALGILVLARILFGGFPFKRGGPGPFGPPWRQHKMQEYWQMLTPEQREKIREDMRQRGCDWPPAAEK